MNDPISMELDEMTEMVFEDPEGVARLLRALGYDAYELAEALESFDDTEMPF